MFQARILAVKTHSADVERLISYYNILKTQMRSSLSPEVIHNYLYVKLNMSCLSKFNPQPAVLYWLKDKKRHDKVHPNAVKQEWFTGVFSEASKTIPFSDQNYTKISF